MHFWLTSASADFESGKTIRSPAYFCIFSCREHLAAAIAHITGAPLLHWSVNVWVAVGTAVTCRPPHRSVRAELPHKMWLSTFYA